jgi:alkylation response protein AidB-like acyl-CoA dehydrogenase
MYSLHLSPEQLEIRDTVCDFATREVRPVVLKPDRLDVRDRTLPMALVDQASQMGLRTLALSEASGGSGADHLTCCLVTEELAAADADFAAVLAETAWLAHVLFDQAMTDAQREKFLPRFLDDHRCHLAFAGYETGVGTGLGVNYHRPAKIDPVPTTAVKAANGDWIINGTKDCIANAPIAGLFAVLVQIPGRREPGVVVVPADTAGVEVRANDKPWRHGVSGAVTFKDCRVPAEDLLKDGAAALLTGSAAAGRGIPLAQAINVGIARAAYEAALDYARLRVQGGRPIIEHQAIGTKLAEVAIRLEAARAAVWNAAWASDHPEAYADQSLSDLPLQTVAQVFVSETLYHAVKDAAELFGAMGVMRDMPLQKYVHDALVCLHGGDSNSDAKLRIAERLAGYRRAADGVRATAAE